MNKMVNAWVRAEYKQQMLKEYEDNPLIESLPPIANKEEVVRHLSFYPSFDEGERELDSQYRFHVIQRLFTMFQVFPNTLDLESRISRIIRQGYINRNPISTNYSILMSRQNLDEQSKNISFASQTFSSARNLSIIGVSGGGKSTAVEKILSLYPQVVSHHQYKGNPFDFTQLVWLKLECPHDGSVKGLINQFFITVDGLLGTSFFQKYGRSAKLSVNALIPLMTGICLNIGLGMLVIDEIQNISLRGTGTEGVLNFLTHLSNGMGVPLLLIGTYKGMGVLQSEFRQARRGSGQGDFIWERMKRDAYWELFIENLWEFQWVRNPTPLTKKLNATLYDESQGIVDIAIKIFALTQIRAISTGKEQISETLIRKVAKDHLKLIQPMLEALRSNNLKKLAMIEDLYFPFEEGLNKERIILGKEDFLKISREVKESNNDQKKQEEALFRLGLLNVNKVKARDVIRQLLKGNPDTELERLVELAFKKIIIESAETSELSADKEQVESSEVNTENDIREIVKKAGKQNLSVYEGLKLAGVIKPIEEVG